MAGTNRHAGGKASMFRRLVSACMLVVACGDDEPAEDIASACEADSQWVSKHNTCESDRDCVLVGGCSGWGNHAVAAEHQSEARERSEDSLCRQFDGPSYDVRCSVTKRCELVPTGRFCGQPLDSGFTPADSGFTPDGAGDAR
jgi:hypothetical protein